MAILNFSVCKGHAWFWSSRLCLSSFSGHCCEASAVKSAFNGQRRVMFFHIMSCVEKFIQRCLSLVHMFTIVFNNFRPTGKVPNRRDHSSLSQNRPRVFRQHFMSFEKKNTYTHGAPGSQLYALLTIYIFIIVQWQGLSRDVYRGSNFFPSRIRIFSILDPHQRI